MTVPNDQGTARAEAAAAKAYSKAQRPWVLRHKILTGLGVLVVLGVVVAVASGDQTNTVTVPDPVAPTAAARAVLLSFAGNGMEQSRKFTAAGDWDLAYSYDCAKFGQSGNFAVEVMGDGGTPSLSNPGVNELGMKGADVTHEHNGGTYYLSVTSECAWTVRVTSA